MLANEQLDIYRNDCSPLRLETSCRSLPPSTSRRKRVAHTPGLFDDARARKKVEEEWARSSLKYPFLRSGTEPFVLPRLPSPRGHARNPASIEQHMSSLRPSRERARNPTSIERFYVFPSSLTKWTRKHSTSTPSPKPDSHYVMTTISTGNACILDTETSPPSFTHQPPKQSSIDCAI